MKEHDRFEALAGAVALGEASAVERAEFEAHAAACASCRADLDADFAPLAQLAAARECERWQPALESAVLARARERRALRSRFTIGALAWAAGLSIAANVIVVTGLSSQVLGAFAPAPAPVPVQTAFAIRLPADAFANLPHRLAAAPRALASHRFVPPRASLRALAALRSNDGAREQRSSVLAPADPLADLLTTDTNAHRRLAVETSLGSGTSLQP